MILALAAALLADPYLLEIGAAGTVMARMGQIVETRTGRVVSTDSVAAAADGHRFIYLGENHATAPHQQLHADILQALAWRGREVAVGLEFLTRPKQAALASWLKPTTEEGAWLADVDWKGQWGYDFAFYRPVFEVARRYQMPLVALNVPRDWVRTVGRHGYAGLSEEQRKQLSPEFVLDNKQHRAIFEALIGGHPLQGERGENMYAAQVLWDEGMADTAIRWLEANTVSSRTIFAVLAGSGHVMYGQGINWRIERRTGKPGISVVMLTAESDRQVAKGIGDFVFLSRPAR